MQTLGEESLNWRQKEWPSNDLFPIHSHTSVSHQIGAWALESDGMGSSPYCTTNQYVTSGKSLSLSESLWPPLQSEGWNTYTDWQPVMCYFIILLLSCIRLSWLSTQNGDVPKLKMWSSTAKAAYGLYSVCGSPPGGEYKSGGERHQICLVFCLSRPHAS